MDNRSLAPMLPFIVPQVGGGTATTAAFISPSYINGMKLLSL
jgi:hypothetical protein